MYGITPPKEAAAVEGDGGEEGEEGEEDIEASIKKELEGYKAPKSDAAREKWAFSIVPVVMDCVLFVKTRAPVQPVEFCRRICEDAKACTNLMERKTRYVNRLTPVTAMNKASEKGIDRAAREALAHWFTLNKATASTEGEDKSGEDKSNEDKGEDKSGDEVQTEASDAAKAAGTEKPAYTVSHGSRCLPHLLVADMFIRSMRFGSRSAATTTCSMRTSSSRSRPSPTPVTRST